MNEYPVKPSGKVDMDALVQALKRLNVPHTDSVTDRGRVVSLGEDSDYEVHVKSRLLAKASTSILIRYEHPVLKQLVIDWLDRCGAKVADNFFTWHLTLSPSVLRGIKARWRLDLTDLPAAPVSLGKVVLVFMFSRNVADEIASQLASTPHRPLAHDESLKCPEFTVSGDDPLDTVIYGWRSEAGSRMFVVLASAPAMTLLSLWVVSDPSSIEIRMAELPG